MKKVLHVAVREFLATVMTKGFLFGIVIMPVMILIMIVGMRFLFNEEAPRVEGEIAVVDSTGEVYAGLRDYLQPEEIAKRRDDFDKLVEEQLPEGVKAVLGTPATEAAQAQVIASLHGEVPALDVVELDRFTEIEEAKTPLRGGDATQGGRLALVVVHDDAVVKAPDKERLGNYDLFVREKLDDRIVDQIKRGMWNSIVDARVRQANLDRELIDSLTNVGRVRSRTVTAEGEEETNEIFNVLLPMGFMILLFASVMTSGQSLMTTMVEEKSSRVVEVLLSSVDPDEMMMGKLVGLGGAGMLQVIVWFGMVIFSSLVFATSLQLAGVDIPWSSLAVAVPFFLAGYLFL